jgi:hypothetical protein
VEPPFGERSGDEELPYSLSTVFAPALSELSSELCRAVLEELWDERFMK